MKKRTRSRSKRVEKKQVKPVSKSPSAGLLLIAGIALVVLIAGGLFLLSTKPAKTDVAATVNGRVITNDMLEFQYNLLPAAYKQLFTRDQVLAQIIDEELIVQAAEREGMTVTPQNVTERIQGIMQENSLTANDLQQNLAMLNVSIDQFEALVRRQLYIEQYTVKHVVPVTPDEATLQALYNASIAKYTVGEQVTVKHILISTQRENAAVIAKNIYDRVSAGENFCEYVKNSSDDKGGRDICGQYTFGRNFMVPEFEKASFSMKDGEFRMIQSQFGYHVILKVNASAPTVKPFSAVKDELAEEAKSGERSQQYRTLVETLRESATITYPNGTVLMPHQPSNIVAAPEGPVAPQEPVAPEKPAPEKTLDPVPTPAKNDTVVPLPLPEKPVPAPETPPAPTPAPLDSKALMQCIATKSTLYGTSWEADTHDAIAMFTRQGVQITSVLCDQTPDMCKGIKAYPTWKIDGTTYLGRMSLEQLKNAASC